MKKLMITVIGAMALWTSGAKSAWAGKSSDGYMAVDHVGVPVTPGAPVVCGTFEAAKDALARAVLTPSAEVAAVFDSDDARQKYCEMFEFDIVENPDGEWTVAAFLKPEPWTNVVESAQAATRQIPVADIAMLGLGDALQNLPLTNCVPGFYYSLYDGTTVTNIKTDLYEDNRNILCGPDTTVEIPVLAQPSSASGFFSIGVLEAPVVIPGEAETSTNWSAIPRSRDKHDIL